jgi:hypothetical protein
MKRKTRPDVETLKNDPAFRQVMELDFDEMIPFVLEHIKRKSLISLFYWVINISFLIFIVYVIISGLLWNQLTWPVIIRQSLTGIIAGSILVIPVHELLHGIAYRILGARQIRFGADMQQFIFFVTADRYPVSGKELYFLALAPFIVINLVTVAIILLWFPGVILFSAFFLLSHNIMCIGDFAIVNSVLQGGAGRIFTFDEVENKKSYFYEKISP